MRGFGFRVLGGLGFRGQGLGCWLLLGVDSDCWSSLSSCGGHRFMHLALNIGASVTRTWRVDIIQNKTGAVGIVILH